MSENQTVDELEANKITADSAYHGLVAADKASLLTLQTHNITFLDDPASPFYIHIGPQDTPSSTEYKIIEVPYIDSGNYYMSLREPETGSTWWSISIRNNHSNLIVSYSRREMDKDGIPLLEPVLKEIYIYDNNSEAPKVYIKTYVGGNLYWQNQSLNNNPAVTMHDLYPFNIASSGALKCDCIYTSACFHSRTLITSELDVNGEARFRKPIIVEDDNGSPVPSISIKSNQISETFRNEYTISGPSTKPYHEKIPGDTTGYNFKINENTIIGSENEPRDLCITGNIQLGNGTNQITTNKPLKDQNIPKWDETENCLVDSKIRENDTGVVVNGNLQATGTSQFDGEVSIGSENKKVDLHINGDIIQHGTVYETHAEQIYSTKDYIVIREGAASGLVNDEVAGLKIIKPNGSYDIHLCVKNDNFAYIGEVSSESVENYGKYYFVDRGLYYDDNEESSTYEQYFDDSDFTKPHEFYIPSEAIEVFMEKTDREDGKCDVSIYYKLTEESLQRLLTVDKNAEDQSLLYYDDCLKEAKTLIKPENQQNPLVPVLDGGRITYREYTSGEGDANNWSGTLEEYEQDIQIANQNNPNYIKDGSGVDIYGITAADLDISTEVRNGDSQPVTSGAVYNFVTNYIDNQEEVLDRYTTAEIKTNKVWINGQPIYRKSGYLHEVPKNVKVTLDSTITMEKIDCIFSMGGSLKLDDGFVGLGGYIYVTGVSGLKVVRLSLQIRSEGIVLLQITADNAISDLNWWIEYVYKTT